MINTTLRKHTSMLLPCLLGFFLSYGQAPVANFTATPLRGCVPVVVSFTDNSTGNPTSWSWDFGNGNTSTLRNPITTYLLPGAYTITLTVNNPSGSNTLSKSQYIIVGDNPTADFSATNTNGCFPLYTQFTDISTPGTGNTMTGWQWDFGDGGTSTLQNPVHAYTAPGSYSVSLMVTNDKGCFKVKTRTNLVTVAPGVDAQFTHTNPTVCQAPSTIVFTNTSTGPGTLTYAWDFGDAGTSNLANPTHTYITNGLFNPRLIVTSSAGCIDTVFGTPVALGLNTTNFSFPTTICAGDTAFFNNTSSPVPGASTWHFGDGGTATGLNATHVYAAAGPYTVKLINTYSSCTDSITHVVNVIALPVADFSALTRKACKPPLTVNFEDDTAPPATSWQWDFGDGFTSTVQNPIHTYTTYGQFNVRLIVSNANGCKDTIIKNAFVDIRKIVVTVPQLPFEHCLPGVFSPVPAVNAVDTVLTWNWAFGDGGTSTLQNPTYTYNTQGVYGVVLITTTTGGCTDTTRFADSVRVGTHPTVDFTASPVPVCADQPVQFTDLSVPADRWNWDFGDFSNSGLKNPTHRYQDTGYFSVRLIATNTGCSDTLVKTDLIYVLPPLARFNYSVDCSNKTTFLFRDSSILPLTWHWEFGDGGTAVIANPTHIYPALGSYTVRLIVSNGGCIDTLDQNIKAVDEQPNFMVSNDTICRKTSTLFTVTNTDLSNIASYTWDFGDGGTVTTTNSSISHVYNNAGNYTVLLTATDINGCLMVRSKPNFIRVNGPSANFNTSQNACYNTPHLFTDNSATDGIHAITNWFWDFGDGNTQNFSGPPFTHTYTTGGVVGVKMIITDASGCQDSIYYANYVSIWNPQPKMFLSDTLSCTGSPITFTDGSFPFISSFSWNFGDGNTSVISPVNHAYTDTGYYTVTHAVQDVFGCRDSISIRVNIRDPKADFTMSDTLSSCTPFRVSFTNLSIHYKSLLWDFGPGEGTSTSPNPIHYFSTPGTYNIKLRITSAGDCVDSMIRSITLFDTAGSRIDYLPLGGCRPLTVNLSTLTPGPMGSYFWDFGDGITDTTTTPNTTHVYNSYGSFTPMLIMQDPTGCIIPLSGLTTIKSSGADANLGAADSLFCDRAFVQFTDSSTFNDPIVSFNWDFGDGGTATIQHPSHTYNLPGQYTVQLIVKTALGCLDTFAKQNYIRIVQRPLVNISGDTIGCARSSVDHAGIFIQPDTSVVSWNWNFPNGNISSVQDPPAQVYNNPGDYSIRVIATNSTGCKDTVNRNLHIKPLPNAILPGSMTVQNGFPTVIPATYSPGVISWNWTPTNGLSCTNCPTPAVSPTYKTTYRVVYTDGFGCSNFSEVVVYAICKNANLFIPNSFTPNNDGNNDMFYPRGKGLDKVKSLRIFNRWGQIVFEKKDFPVNDASQGWNGSFKGTRPIAGVYIYQAEVYCENGEVITLNGNVALIL